jgi:bacterioferritin (cytochrome b1)
MHSSTFWKNHFSKNLEQERVDWNIIPSLTESEKENIMYSLKAWQLGETSEGVQLLNATKKYAQKIKDPVYVDAMKLFIKEEQKHGNNLGKYIDLIGERRKTVDWGDSLFRKVRHLNSSIESWTITVIIVEYAAQIFYAALRDATRCDLLKSICNDILIDEAHHIKYQNERLKIIFERKNMYVKAFSIGIYGILFFFTIHAVWFGHQKAFKAGGVSKQEFMRKMNFKFFNTLKTIHARVINQDLDSTVQVLG